MDEDVDGEALQAQVDKSVARVNELVASWMKPYKGSTQASKVQEMVEKDIETYSARPPHLGVGAVYEPASTDARDIARLRGRLQQKKRAPSPGTSTAPAHPQEAPDEDDEDSRSKVFSKQSLTLGAVDKFSSKAKKKAAKAAIAAPTASSSSKLGESDSLTGQGSQSISPPSASTSISMPPPTSTKPLHLSPNSSSSNIFSLHKSPTSPKVPSLFRQPSFGAPNHLTGEDDDDSDAEADGNQNEGEHLAQGQKDQDQASSPKRKRKRRKKKHQSTDSDVPSSSIPNNPNANPNSIPTSLHIQLPSHRTNYPSPSPGAESLALSETQSHASLASGPPPSAISSKEVSRATSREGSPGSGLGNLVGQSSLGRSGFASGSGASTGLGLQLPSTSFRFAAPSSSVSIPTTVPGSPIPGASPRRAIHGHGPASGQSKRRKQLHDRIAAKERQNEMARRKQQA